MICYCSRRHLAHWHHSETRRRFFFVVFSGPGPSMLCNLHVEGSGSDGSIDHFARWLGPQEGSVATSGDSLAVTAGLVARIGFPSKNPLKSCFLQEQG